MPTRRRCHHLHTGCCRTRRHLCMCDDFHYLPGSGPKSHRPPSQHSRCTRADLGRGGGMWHSSDRSRLRRRRTRGSRSRSARPRMLLTNPFVGSLSLCSHRNSQKYNCGTPNHAGRGHSHTRSRQCYSSLPGSYCHQFRLIPSTPTRSAPPSPPSPLKPPRRQPSNGPARDPAGYGPRPALPQVFGQGATLQEVVLERTPAGRVAAGLRPA